MCSGPPTWKRLIGQVLTAQERISLITTIFSDRNEIGVVQSLCGDDAQSFIDALDEVHSYIISSRPLTSIQPFASSLPGLESP